MCTFIKPEASSHHKAHFHFLSSFSFFYSSTISTFHGFLERMKNHFPERYGQEPFHRSVLHKNTFWSSSLSTQRCWLLGACRCSTLLFLMNHFGIFFCMLQKVYRWTKSYLESTLINSNFHLFTFCFWYVSLCAF